MASSESQGSGKSGTLSHFEYQECPTQGLQEGDTTIMLRGLVRSINLEGFLKLLRNISSNYDLVYVPVGNKRSTNLGLAFVNYSDPLGARTAFEQLHQARSPHTFRMVKRAYVQGLGPNLAFVLASGDAPLVNKHGIAVFQGSHRIKDVSSLVQRNVTQDMLAEAQVLMARIQTEQKDNKDQRTDSSDHEGSVKSGDVFDIQSSTSGSSGRATWSAERAVGNQFMFAPANVGRSTFDEDFRQMDRPIQSMSGIPPGIPGHQQRPGIPGAWYWQHEIPRYRGREEPLAPLQLPDQQRYHLSWEASGEFRPPPVEPRPENNLQPYQRLVFDL